MEMGSQGIGLEEGAHVKRSWRGWGSGTYFKGMTLVIYFWAAGNMRRNGLEDNRGEKQWTREDHNYIQTMHSYNSACFFFSDTSDCFSCKQGSLFVRLCCLDIVLSTDYYTNGQQ